MSDPASLLQPVSSFYQEHGISISMLRLDRVHPVVSGNKWFKLRYNLAAATEQGYQQVITVGGAYSNHLVATAAAARQAGLSAVGIVRGLHGQQKLTPTLLACREQGMQLHFVSREAYNEKHTLAFQSALEIMFGKSYFIPEGGANEAGRRGAGEIAALLPPGITHVCVPVGTGTTFIGLRNALQADQQLIGFPAMKQGNYLREEIIPYLQPGKNILWQLDDRFHFGGFAKSTPELLAFMQSFYKATAIPLDIVYTSKMMYGVQTLLREHAFPEGAHVACIHTGGLQGNPEGLLLNS